MHRAKTVRLHRTEFDDSARRLPDACSGAPQRTGIGSSGNSRHTQDQPLPLKTQDQACAFPECTSVAGLNSRGRTTRQHFILSSQFASNKAVAGRPPAAGTDHLAHCVAPYRSAREGLLKSEGAFVCFYLLADVRFLTENSPPHATVLDLSSASTTACPLTPPISATQNSGESCSDKQPARNYYVLTGNLRNRPMAHAAFPPRPRKGTTAIIGPFRNGEDGTDAQSRASSTVWHTRAIWASGIPG